MTGLLSSTKLCAVDKAKRRSRCCICAYTALIVFIEYKFEIRQDDSLLTLVCIRKCIAHEIWHFDIWYLLIFDICHLMCIYLSHIVYDIVSYGYQRHRLWRANFSTCSAIRSCRMKKIGGSMKVGRCSIFGEVPLWCPGRQEYGVYAFEQREDLA